ncbi:DUF927 domain-containing protein [Bradyrhizobium sp. 27S5]|uniref:DUF927 domain-containing protein n=1 Tax=Bradyrhizobium sp. 27S5 TaxID=3139728 RepID=UPI0030D59BDC
MIHFGRCRIARQLLMDGRFFIAPSQTARGLFNSFLLQVKSPNRARATQRAGWHSNSFVMPDDCFGVDRRDTLLLQSVTAHEHSFRQSGTLASWQQNVTRYASGNKRLVLAISAAFAGPLVGPCSAEGGGLHFEGASSTGKSTALHVAGSVWGGGDANGYVRSWRATANGLEGVALAHSDTLLPRGNGVRNADDKSRGAICAEKTRIRRPALPVLKVNVSPNSRS